MNESRRQKAVIMLLINQSNSGTKTFTGGRLKIDIVDHGRKLLVMNSEQSSFLRIGSHMRARDSLSGDCFTPLMKFLNTHLQYRPKNYTTICVGGMIFTGYATIEIPTPEYSIQLTEMEALWLLSHLKCPELSGQTYGGYTFFIVNSYTK